MVVVIAITLFSLMWSMDGVAISIGNGHVILPLGA